MRPLPRAQNRTKRAVVVHCIRGRIKKIGLPNGSAKLVSVSKEELHSLLRAELARTDRTVGRSTMQLSRALRTATRGSRFARPAAMSSAAAKADGSEAFVGALQRQPSMPSKRVTTRRSWQKRSHVVTKTGRRESAAARGADATWKDAIDATRNTRRQRPQQAFGRDRPRAPLDHRRREGPPARHARAHCL